MPAKTERSTEWDLHPGLAFLVCILSGALLDWLRPWPPWPAVARFGAGGPLLALGLTLAAWGILTLRGARTPIEPGMTPTRLVIGGPYRISRNPLYLAQLLFLAGLGLLAFPWLLPIGVVQGVLLDRLVIPAEERRLAEAFGTAFEAFRAEVRRWI
jgi:protein-S-isoprenylcysteine O-methyltransferase Ste14